MFTKMLKVSLLSSVLFYSAGASAAGTCTFTTCTGTIDRIYYGKSGDIFLNLAPRVEVEKLNCTARDGIYVTIGSGDPSKNQLYATFLVAFSSGGKISARIEEGSTDCKVQYVFMDK